MQIVIDIPEEKYMEYKRIGDSRDVLFEAIRKGIPLPKEHGRLIDADGLNKEIKGYIINTSNLHYDDLEEADACNSAYYNCLDEIEDEPTIIEADKRSEE